MKSRMQMDKVFLINAHILIKDTPFPVCNFVHDTF